MGWCGGAAIANDVWAMVREYIPVARRREIARKIIDRFEDEDADTMDEAEQLMKDADLTDREEIVEDEWFDRY